MKYLITEGITGAFVSMHLLIMSGGLGVILPLNFNGTVRVWSHSTSREKTVTENREAQ
jgi:hypothetical protein